MRQSRLYLTVLLLHFLAAAAMAQAGGFTVVNAASYGGTVAPDSLATIFGVNLAQTTATATLDASGQLPTELAKTSVQINGVAAPLFYVSPGQINLVVPGGLTEGTATVTIRNTTSGASTSGTAELRAAAPGVFTSDSSGGGPGAILNAVTYRPAPFVVQTADNGSDPRTRLAVYGTGLRHAATVTALGQDPSGNRYPLAVEYAGVAPGFFGLDQVNLRLPPELDGAGTVSLSLSAAGSGANGDANVDANVVTFQMNLLAVSALRLDSVTLSPAVLNAGDSGLLTVGLDGVARFGGFVVGLGSDTPAVQVNPQITIPEGKATTQIAFTTTASSAARTATLTAQAGGVTRTASLAIDPTSAVQLAGLSVSASSILGGRNLTGTVTLSGNAPASGVNILLASDSDRMRPPSVVSVPFGKNSMDFTITTLAVTGAQAVTLTATLSRISSTATFTLLPLLDLALSASAVVGGNPVTATVTLGDPAPVTGAIITMQSGDAAVHVPPVAVPAGQNSFGFTVTTSTVPVARTVTISATYAGVTVTASLTVNPVGAATLTGLTIAPNPVVGGNNTQGTVTLSGPVPSGVVRVDLKTSNIFAATVSPVFLLIPQGQSAAAFTITTARFPGVVTITATAGGVSKTASLTVQ